MKQLCCLSCSDDLVVFCLMLLHLVLTLWTTLQAVFFTPIACADESQSATGATTAVGTWLSCCSSMDKGIYLMASSCCKKATAHRVVSGAADSFSHTDAAHYAHDRRMNNPCMHCISSIPLNPMNTMVTHRVATQLFNSNQDSNCQCFVFQSFFALTGLGKRMQSKP